jgi:hypothetical protein
LISFYQGSRWLLMFPAHRWWLPFGSPQACTVESYPPGGSKSENFLFEKRSHLSTFVAS